MDICVGDKKNCYVFSFLSLSTSRRVFDIIEVGFLPVEYTHEDLDETYGKLSTKLMWKDIFSLQDMMEIYRTHEEHNFYVSYLINEFFDFKSFVEPHLSNGNSKITSIKGC